MASYVGRIAPPGEPNTVVTPSFTRLSQTICAPVRCTRFLRERPKKNHGFPCPVVAVWPDFRLAVGRDPPGQNAQQQQDQQGQSYSDPGRETAGCRASRHKEKVILLLAGAPVKPLIYLPPFINSVDRTDQAAGSGWIQGARYGRRSSRLASSSPVTCPLPWAPASVA